MEADLSHEFSFERFRCSGIVFPIPVLSPDEVWRYGSALQFLVQRVGGDLQRLPSCHLYFAWAYDLALHPAVLTAVAAILGPEIVSWGTLVLRKPPHSRS